MLTGPYAITSGVSPAQRRYLLVEQGVGGAIVNAIINAGFGWLFFHHLAFVPLQGDLSIAGDTVVTGFLVAFITTLIVTALARREVRVGRVPALDAHPVLRWLPRRTWLRGLVLGLAGVALLAIPTVLVLGALGVSGMSFGRFLLFKSTFAAVAGLIFTPLVALYALAGAGVPAAPVRRGSAA